MAKQKTPAKPKSANAVKPKTVKAAKSKPANAAVQEREKLAKELRSLIPKLDEEGLSFLIEQAQVHLYNMQVDALNQTLAMPQTLAASQTRAQNAAAKTAKVNAAGKGGAGSAKGADKPAGFSEIKVSESGSSYYIVYKTEWIMCSRDEIIKLARIASGEGSDLEIKERLFNWLVRERTDLLRSAGIADKFDVKLKSLAGLLKKLKKL
jgi:hypothetical protein